MLIQKTNFQTRCFVLTKMAMTPQGLFWAVPQGRFVPGRGLGCAPIGRNFGVPILKTLTGDAILEGADLIWLDEKTAAIGRGHRTNQQAITRSPGAVEIGGDTRRRLTYGTMHFMGML